MSALLETMLLRVHITMVERATTSVSALSGSVARERIGELSMVRRGGHSGGIAATNLRQHQIKRADAKRERSMRHTHGEIKRLLLDM